jgi:3'(2'), 5'-bisphosphate nucleotidase
MQFDELWSSLANELIRILSGYRSRLADLDVRAKPDNTLLTEADLAVEDLIMKRIREFDPTAVIVGEEDGKENRRDEVLSAPGLFWVIDPIDGTAEFVKPTHREFCSVVCVLQDLEPIASFFLAPELGLDQQPLLITADRSTGAVVVNGSTVKPSRQDQGPRWVSVTRSSGSIPRPFDAQLEAAGYRLKTRTTSQTLDMVRTAIDLTPYAGATFPQFDLFFRTEQKVWDGLAGLCLGETVGLRNADRTGDRRLPVDISILSQAEPTFDFTVMGLPEVVTWFMEIV